MTDKPTIIACHDIEELYKETVLEQNQLTYIIEQCEISILDDEKCLKMIGEDFAQSATRHMLLGRIDAYNKVLKLLQNMKGIK